MCAQSVGRRGAGIASAVLALALASPATAQTWDRPTLNFRGMPGIVDMPSAHHFNDADGAISYGEFFDGIQRSTFHFQILPRISGAFRYSEIFGAGAEVQDRSFDLRFLLLEEGRYRPAITLGLQDFLGTGVMSGEYLVATKTIGRFRATAGLGWGRFGSNGGFENPLAVFDDRFKTRPTGTTGLGGNVESDRFFRGDAAFFGGVQYLATDNLVLSAEYSSDAYTREVTTYGFERKSDFNYAATWRFDNGVDATVAWLYGSTLGLQLAYNFNPKTAAPPQATLPSSSAARAVAAVALGAEGQVGGPLRLQGTTPLLVQSYPALTYAFDLYAGPTESDPDNFLAEGGLRFESRLALGQGVSLNAELRQPFFVNRPEALPNPATRGSPNYPQVRTDASLYEDDTDLELRRLTADARFKLSDSVYAQVSAGLLEQMYGGATAAVLWQPAASRLGLGAEVSWVKKRSPNDAFGFEPLERTTGFVSAHYEFGQGFVGQIEAGQYLAGDRGATVSLDREFDNGFRIGAYATLTDMPDTDYGEGSFDKGIRFSVPASWILGIQTDKTYSATWRPNAGDGGQRVKDAVNLYEEVRAGRFLTD